MKDDECSFEQRLIAAAQAGDTRAFEELVKRYSRRIYRLAFSFLRNLEDASEAVQEVFLRAYRNLDRFDRSRAFYPWLHRITRNFCINLSKKGSYREGTLPDDGLIKALTPDPLEAAMASEEVETLKKAIAALPEVHRSIILLKYFEECTYVEMAEILDIPVGTVMSRLYNARVKLRSLLLEEVASGNEL